MKVRDQSFIPQLFPGMVLSMAFRGGGSSIAPCPSTRSTAANPSTPAATTNESRPISQLRVVTQVNLNLPFRVSVPGLEF